MKRRDFLFVIISILFLIIGGFFCLKSVDSNKNTPIEEKSKANYTVCLKENNYYNETCLGEGKEYLSSITDTIRINYEYEKTSFTKSSTEYYIGANLKIYNNENNKEIYNKEYVLKEKQQAGNGKEVINIADSVDIKYDDYNQLVNRYIFDYGVNTTSLLEVYLSVKDGGKDSRVASVNIPINSQTYSISREVLETNLTKSVDESYKTDLILGLLSIVLSIVIIVVIVYRHIQNAKSSNFDLEVNRLLNEYDRVIVETKLEGLDIKGKELIEVNDFMELIDVRDTIEKPIMYFKRNEYVRDFIVLDNNLLYRYRFIDKENEDKIDDDDPIITKIEYHNKDESNDKLNNDIELKSNINDKLNNNTELKSNINELDVNKTNEIKMENNIISKENNERFDKTFELSELNFNEVNDNDNINHDEEVK